MRLAGFLLCTLPVLAQEAKTLYPPPNIIFYAQREPRSQVSSAAPLVPSPRLGKGSSFFTFGFLATPDTSDAMRSFSHTAPRAHTW